MRDTNHSVEHLFLLFLRGGSSSRKFFTSSDEEFSASWFNRGRNFQPCVQSSDKYITSTLMASFLESHIYITPSPPLSSTADFNCKDIYTSFKSQFLLELNLEWIWASVRVRERLRCEAWPFEGQGSQVHLKRPRSIFFGWFIFVTLEAYF